MQNRYHYVVSFCSEESDELLSVAKNTSTIAFQILRDAQDDNLTGGIRFDTASF